MHDNYFSGSLAFAAPPAQSGSAGASPSLFGNPMVFLVLMVVMMYFVLIRPQQLRTKQQAKMLAALKAGDKVVTAAGIVGTVITIKEKDKTVTLRSGDAKFEVTKASITEVMPADASNPTAA
jgi:preprotein translocase subunit YajC